MTFSICKSDLKKRLIDSLVEDEHYPSERWIVINKLNRKVIN
jgi:hypothetical protein